MPPTKTSKKRLAAGKKQETIKPLKTKVVDAASPNLFIGCATGKHYTGLTK
jgi:type VI protein secretion system component Hcp